MWFANILPILFNRLVRKDAWRDIPILGVFFLVEPKLITLGPLASVFFILCGLWKENRGEKTYE